jgi:creatinine amidohydrolase
MMLSRVGPAPPSEFVIDIFVKWHHKATIRSGLRGFGRIHAKSIGMGRMSLKPPPRDWEAIRWPDISPEAARDWIAVLPLAAIEQHGPHLPLGTDAMIAEAYLSRARRMMRESLPAVFLPLQAIGISTEHTAFPGTVSLPPAAAIAAWQAIGASVARTGIRKFVIVNSHGGNSPAINVVAQELRAAHALFVVTSAWHRFGYPKGLFETEELRHGIHGGAVETSLMLAARPDLVRMDLAANFAPASIEVERSTRWLGTGRAGPYAWMAQDLHASGAAGNATLATAEKGDSALEHGARGFCELLEEIDGYSLDRLARGPLD